MIVALQNPRPNVAVSRVDEKRGRCHSTGREVRGESTRRAAMARCGRVGTGGYWWVLVRTRGSHQQFKQPVKFGPVTVAGSGNDDFAPGTLNSILKQAGLKTSGQE